jgi:hypothetical protein
MACNLGYTAFEERNMTNEMTEKQSVTMISRENSESESEGENNMNNSLAAIMAFSLIYN